MVGGRFKSKGAHAKACLHAMKCCSFATLGVDIGHHFEKFGQVMNVRHFKEHCNAFVRFAKKEFAARAIFEMNGADVGGHKLKCNWSRSEVGATPPSHQTAEHPRVISQDLRLWLGPPVILPLLMSHTSNLRPLSSGLIPPDFRTQNAGRPTVPRKKLATSDLWAKSLGQQALSPRDLWITYATLPENLQ
jgi:hypothetical protein